MVFCLQINWAQQSNFYAAKEAHADSLLDRANKIFYSNPDSSLYYTNEALNFATKNNLEVRMALAWRSQAKHCVLKGDVELALKKLKEAIAVFEKYNRQDNIAKCYSLMSVALGKIHNDYEGIDYLLKAVAIYERTENKEGLRSTLVNLANSYADVKEFDKALEALRESKPFIEDGSSEWFYYYINAGIIFRNQKKYALAKIQFDSCLVISKRNHMIDAEVTAHTDMADLLRETNRYKEAIVFYNQAIIMARKNNLPVEESEALVGITKSYAATAEFKEAFFSQNRLKIISDSLFDIQKIKNINTIEARLKVSEKEKTIALQKLSMEQSAVEQEKSAERIAYLIIGVCVLIFILIFTYRTYLKVRRQKNEVEIQKARAEKLNQLNQKIFAVIAHDFKSPLITLQMLIDLMDKENISKEDLNAYTVDVKNQIIQSGQILENLLNWAKSELNLTPNSHQFSTPKHIATEVIKEMEYISTRKLIKVTNNIDESLSLQFPPDILKIIIRNLLSNAIKFSYSNSEVIICSEENAVVCIKDTGLGLSPKAINQLFNGTVKSQLGTFNETGFGLGLYITYELIHKFGGKIWVENNQPVGSVFKFTGIKNG